MEVCIEYTSGTMLTSILHRRYLFTVMHPNIPSCLDFTFKSDNEQKMLNFDLNLKKSKSHKTCVRANLSLKIHLKTLILRKMSFFEFFGKIDF